MIFDHFLNTFLRGRYIWGLIDFFSNAYILIYVENVKPLPCMPINFSLLRFLTGDWPAAGSKHVQTCQTVEVSSQTHRLCPGELSTAIFLYFGGGRQIFEVLHIFCVYVLPICRFAFALNALDKFSSDAFVSYAFISLPSPLRSLDDRPARGSRLQQPPCRLPSRARLDFSPDS